jgi:hypothetical protein
MSADVKTAPPTLADAEAQEADVRRRSVMMRRPKTIGGGRL